MDCNDITITEARWRRLPPTLRAELLQVLEGKSAIIGRHVLDVARTLGSSQAYDLAWQLYQVLDGQPASPYQGCGFGLMQALQHYMGENPDRRDKWVYRDEEVLLLFRPQLPRKGQEDNHAHPDGDRAADAGAPHRRRRRYRSKPGHGVLYMGAELSQLADGRGEI